MKKKILALCLVVALMATAIAGATLAYFTDKTEVVTNTFTVGDIDIKLDETDIDGEEGARTEEGNTYENIYPGQTVTKDPMVTFVKDSRDCYVRMIVTVDTKVLAEAFPKTAYADLWKGDIFLLEKLVAGWDENTWMIQDTDKVAGGEYEFWYKEMVAAEDAEEDDFLPALFTSITFPTGMTNAQIGALDQFEVDVVAHAMQAEGFADQAAAWAAFPTT